MEHGQARGPVATNTAIQSCVLRYSVSRQHMHRRCRFGVAGLRCFRSCWRLGVPACVATGRKWLQVLAALMYSGLHACSPWVACLHTPLSQQHTS